ncbi:unnamed protein product [Rotaria sp. Silwood2]|nr:unnamed protein product [Rotaria sp. Silwood2]CAF2716781.1 unnamed protein product [Rotaria sp. Silwood2]CAF4074347.1 unnamed protein product [Rotaria sp. Silwood2]CAF4087822.1 unnamed protein product [Rotaria sp. Silwood2]CAF4159552.1 unnamed protein product [Rotaria sp. Silwood2]
MIKKILLFSPPFNGHLNVLRDLILKYENYFNFHLIITGWKNTQPDLKGINIQSSIVAYSDLYETDPAIWTLPRIVDLIDGCLDIAKQFKPDLIIYDFFSLEGNFVGKILKIPYYCSIPALLGPFTHQEYLKRKLLLPINIKAITCLQEKFPGILDTDDFEMISDGLHITGQQNLVWSYPSLTPKDFMLNRKQTSYIFVHHLHKVLSNNNFIDIKKPLIYFSFGTAVMGNLWNQQLDVREKLKLFIHTLTKLWENKNFNIIFVNLGKEIGNEYPPNWQVVQYADQIDVLSRASVFITHAGGNSFHEAVIAQVPMVAIPFFGDQLLIAHQIEKLGLGINLIADNEIDTKKPKNFLNELLAEKVVMAVDKILNENTDYQKRFTQLSLEADNILDLLNNDPR